MKKVKLGIIGIGGMGSGHAKNIVAGKVSELELTAVADLRDSRRIWAKENLPQEVRIFDDAESLISSGCCEAVLIATPVSYTHLDVYKRQEPGQAASTSALKGKPGFP